MICFDRMVLLNMFDLGCPSLDNPQECATKHWITYWSQPSTFRTPVLHRGHRFTCHFLSCTSRPGSKSGLHSSPRWERERQFVHIELEHLGQTTEAKMRFLLSVRRVPNVWGIEYMRLSVEPFSTSICTNGKQYALKHHNKVATVCQKNLT